MPPPTKRQRKESADTGALHDDQSRESFPPAGQAKAPANKKQRKDCAHATLLKHEWRDLSRSAKSRHVKNEVKARLRAMIPGPGKVSENSLMLQAASRIRELEIEIHSACNRLERIQKQSNNRSADNLKDQSADADNLEYQSLVAAVPAVDQEGDGPEAIRAVLPQTTKAKGSRLMESAWQYLTELIQERDQVIQQITEHQGCTEAQVWTPADKDK